MASEAMQPGETTGGTGEEAVWGPGTRQSENPPPLGFKTRTAFGIGAIANGVKNAGLATYITFYFNQVVGVDASIIGIAYAATLIVDAIADPLLGHWTDITRSRWGRRHPFMYFAAIPTALFFYFVWFPPSGLSDLQIGIWVFAFAALARMSISGFEIASSALAPEMAPEYSQRTKLFSLRYLFGYIGAFGFSSISLWLIFKKTPEYPLGQLNPDSYQGFALFGASLIFFAIMTSALGTHNRIPYLPQAEEKRERMSLLGHAAETLSAFKNRAFLTIFGFGVFKYTAIGVYTITTVYFSTYLFELTSTQMAILTVDSVVAALLAAPLAPVFSNLIGKRASSMLFAVVGVGIGLSPLILTYFDMFFLPGDPRLIWSLFAIGAIYGAMVAISLINTSAMLADVVEDAAVKTGKHTAGTFFAASSFMQQCSGALGSLVATQILVSSGFPKKVDPSQVTEAMTDSLLLHYIPTSFGLWSIGCLFLLFYPITRKDHEANIERLRARRAEAKELAMQNVASGAPMR